MLSDQGWGFVGVCCLSFLLVGWKGWNRVHWGLLDVPKPIQIRDIIRKGMFVLSGNYAVHSVRTLSECCPIWILTWEWIRVHVYTGYIRTYRIQNCFCIFWNLIERIHNHCSATENTSSEFLSRIFQPSLC